MLSPTDVMELIKGGEGYNLEFKERVPKKLRELSMEICAFANAAGGILLIGVNDKNIIIGANIDNHKRAAIQNALNDINPPLDCSIYELNLKEKNLWVVEVESGPQKPYTLSGTIFVRQGSINKAQILDDKVFGGPLIKQYVSSMQWLKSKLDVQYLIEGSGPREEVMEIPEVVFKEALINALAHRDYYDKGARITVELFDDRVEITNPGNLVSAISFEDFGFKSHKKSYARK